VAQEVFHTCLLDASKEFDTAKGIIYRASSTPTGVGLTRRSHFPTGRAREGGAWRVWGRD